jgi:hypothetical protein
MESRPPMTRPDVAPEVPNSNDECVPHQGGTPRTPPARVPVVAEFKHGSPNELNDKA